MQHSKIRNGKRAACNHRAMDASAPLGAYLSLAKKR